MTEGRGPGVKATGYVRRVDHLGRVVVPRPLRRQLGLGPGTPIVIAVDGEDIVLEKYTGARGGRLLRPHQRLLLTTSPIRAVGGRTCPRKVGGAPFESPGPDHGQFVPESPTAARPRVTKDEGG